MSEISQTGIKINGFHRGIVKAHSQNGKCKIFWPVVFDMEYNKDENINLLPDAEPAKSLFMYGSTIEGNKGEGNGFYSYPPIGSVVWGFFENEDQNKPVYFAGTFMENETNINRYNLLKDTTQGAFYLDSDNGTFKVSLNEGNEWVSITSEKENESSIKLFKDGSISIDAPSGSVSINAANITLNASSTLTVNSAQKTNVSSNGRIGIGAGLGLVLHGAKGTFIRGSKPGKTYL